MKSNEQWWRTMKNYQKRWKTKKNNEKWWKMIKNDKKQWTTIKNNEKLSKTMKNDGNDAKRWKTMKNNEKMMKNDEKLWKTMKNNEKQWKTVNNSEKQWKTVKNDEKRWETMKNKPGGTMQKSEVNKQTFRSLEWWKTMVWSGLVWRTLYILAPMLKIYIYWHKCYFGHGDEQRTTNNRVNLVQVCSLNIEQSRLLHYKWKDKDNYNYNHHDNIYNIYNKQYTIYPQNGDLTKSLKSAQKKSAPECPFECGVGGCNCYLGNAQIEVMLTSKVLP